jgi:Ca-activated chloride channel homolog
MNSLLHRASAALAACAIALQVALPAVPVSAYDAAESVSIHTIADTAELTDNAIINMHPYIADFQLDRTISRREMAKVIFRFKAIVQGTSTDAPTSCQGLYTDLPPGDWGCPYAEALRLDHIFVPNALFRPDDSVSRYEMVLMISRVFGANDLTVTWLSFDAAMQALVEGEIITDTERSGLQSDGKIYEAASRGFSFGLVRRALLTTSAYRNTPNSTSTGSTSDLDTGFDLDDLYGDMGSAGNIGYTAGGAQTFQAMRDKLIMGQDVDPAKIDENGIFADYFFKRPDGTCQDEFCPLLDNAYIKNPVTLKREYWTQIALGSNIDVKDYKRKPARFVVVLDQSGSMGDDMPDTAAAIDPNHAGCATGESYDTFLRSCVSGAQADVSTYWDTMRSSTKMQIADEALARMVGAFSDDDEISVITFDDVARVRQRLMPLAKIDRSVLQSHIRAVEPQGSTNMEDAYEEALKAFDKPLDSKYENRIIFLTDAMPTTGDTSSHTLGGLISKASAQGVNTTFIGVGLDYDESFVDSISEVPGANWMYANAARDLYDRLVTEFDYNFFPMFSDVRFYTPDGAQIERVIGTGDSSPKLDDTGAYDVFKVKTLFPTAPTASGNRGGVILVKYRDKPTKDIPYIVTYTDRSGARRLVQATQDQDGWLKGSDAMGKAYLLALYVQAIKKTITDRDFTLLADVKTALEQYSSFFSDAEREMYDREFLVIQALRDRYDPKGDFWQE